MANNNSRAARGTPVVAVDVTLVDGSFESRSYVTAQSLIKFAIDQVGPMPYGINLNSRGWTTERGSVRFRTLSGDAERETLDWLTRKGSTGAKFRPTKGATVAEPTNPKLNNKTRDLRLVSGTTRDLVAQLHVDRPDLGITEIAALCGVTRQRVDQIAKELGIAFKSRHGRSEFKVAPPTAPTPEEVRMWRQDHGDITQATLADLLGVSKDTIARWERGTRPAPALLTVAFEALARRANLQTPDS